jgi:hypothetical protein
MLSGPLPYVRLVFHGWVYSWEQVCAYAFEGMEVFSFIPLEAQEKNL